MKSVFILWHSYELDGCDETKFIGVYTTKENAENALERLKKQPGFNKITGFVLEECDLNKDHWTEGFITVAWLHSPR